MLREAVLSDAEELYEIEKLSFNEPWSKSAFEDSINAEAVIVEICEADQIEGFIVYSLICGEAEVYDIAVSPAHRRKGIGEMLLKNMLQKCERAFLEVRESNAGAKALYKKMGFKESGMRKGYYSDGENAVVMIYERNE